MKIYVDLYKIRKCVAMIWSEHLVSVILFILCLFTLTVCVCFVVIVIWMLCNVCACISMHYIRFYIHAPDQMIHDLARSTDANTELNGFHATAVTAAALRINKPPGLGRWENNVFQIDANKITHIYTLKTNSLQNRNRRRSDKLGQVLSSKPETKILAEKSNIRITRSKKKKKYMNNLSDC